MIPRSFFYLLIAFNVFSIFSQEYSKIGTYDFNFDWEFKLQENTFESDMKIYQDWTKINLPHDWSVHFPFNSTEGEGATGYLPGGKGIYKKNFVIDNNKDVTTYLLFDGVYNNSVVNINGTLLGSRPYGYAPFYFDISKNLKQGKQNTIEVNIDRSRFADSRWYTGSGIYRNVRLIRKDKLHIPVWGTFVTTPKISGNEALVVVKSSIKNNYDEGHSFDVKISVYNDKNSLVVEKIKSYSVIAQKEITTENTIKISNPYLWSIDNPKMYNVKVQLIKNNKVIDNNNIKFGVRDIKFDVNKGFFLNGKNTLIKGVCLHHDGGLVGSAVPKDVWRRRLLKLKNAGCNAIRIAHNPGSEEFLDLCDEMGFLVQDEFFDEWDNPKDKRFNMNERSVDRITQGYTEHFQKWAEKDLKNTILAHRNHPSIFQWSIGNEIEWTYPRNQNATGFFNNMNWSGSYFWEEPPFSKEKIKRKLDSLPKGKYDIGKTAQKLVKWTKELDTTRYVTANCILPSVSHLSGYAEALDVVGYSYRRVLYDYGHKNYPNKPIMGTENLVQWHEWKAVEERPFISGTFLWTGIDYMGESNNKWPRKATASGMLDIAGFEKPSYHMMKTLWNKEPHIYVATQTIAKSIFKEDTQTGKVVEKKKGKWKKALWVWHNVNEHWNYNFNEKIVVEAYSNFEEIELCLNGKSFQTKKLENFEDRIYKWVVPFQEGELKLIGKNGGEVQEIKVLNTVGKVTQVSLTTDKKTIRADGYRVAHIVAQLKDTKGNPIKNEDEEIVFSVEGDVQVLGVDNGSAYSVQDYKSNTVTTNKGKCLLIIQSKRKNTEALITASAKEFKSKALKIVVK